MANPRQRELIDEIAAEVKRAQDDVFDRLVEVGMVGPVQQDLDKAHSAWIDATEALITECHRLCNAADGAAISDRIIADFIELSRVQWSSR